MATAAHSNNYYDRCKSESVGVCSKSCSERNFSCMSLCEVCVVAPGCHRYDGMSSDCVLSVVRMRERPLAVPSLAGCLAECVLGGALLISLLLGKVMGSRHCGPQLRQLDK